MTLNVAIQMDPLEKLQWATDTSIILAAEAEKRGARIFVYQPERLTWQPGMLTAPARQISGLNPPSAEHKAGHEEMLDLGSMDVILVRQDPPVDIPYLTATWLLELAHKGVLVVNNPRGLRDTPEKLVVQHFPDLSPPTLITRELDAIAAFRSVHGDVVLKPVYGFGGHGVFHLTPHDTNASALLELMLNNSRDPIIVQKFLPEIAAGDKRIILIDGEPVGAIHRMAASHEFRTNLRAQGTASASSITEQDRKICATLAPWLKAHGILLAGVDVVGPWVLEVNVTSPTGLAPLKRLTGIDAAPLFWDAVDAKRKAQKS